MHDFKVGDVVFLPLSGKFSILPNTDTVGLANSMHYIRKATKGEARKYRKEYRKRGQQ